MYATIASFFNILCASLLIGTTFGVWLTFNPHGLGASEYVAMQRRGISALNTFMPLFGAVTILLTILSAVLAHDDRTRLYLLIAAVLCFVVAGLVTRFLNQPINAVLMTWQVESPPPEWSELRDAWWRWHIVRTIFGCGALCLLIIAALRGAVAGP